MPWVRNKMAEGCTTDQKKAMIKPVTEAIAATIEANPKVIWVPMDESDGDNFTADGQGMMDEL